MPDICSPQDRRRKEDLKLLLLLLLLHLVYLSIIPGDSKGARISGLERSNSDGIPQI
jgi:hypothetical protein